MRRLALLLLVLFPALTQAQSGPTVPGSNGGGKEPWLDVTRFGAVGDVRTGRDGAVQAGSGVLTAPSLACAEADRGKLLTVSGAGGAMLLATVNGCEGATHMRFSPAAAVTVSSGARWAVGTDNTAALNGAIQAAIKACGGTLLVPAGNYFVRGELRIQPSREQASACPVKESPLVGISIEIEGAGSRSSLLIQNDPHRTLLISHAGAVPLHFVMQHIGLLGRGTATQGNLYEDWSVGALLYDVYFAGHGGRAVLQESERLTTTNVEYSAVRQALVQGYVGTNESYFYNTQALGIGRVVDPVMPGGPAYSYNVNAVEGVFPVLASETANWQRGATAITLTSTFCLACFGAVDAGMSVAGPGIAPGTHVAGSNGAVVSLSKPTSADGNSATVYFGNALIRAATARWTAGSVQVAMSSTEGLAAGMGVAGEGIPVGTFIDAVGAGTITLNQAPTSGGAEGELLMVPPIHPEMHAAFSLGYGGGGNNVQNNLWQGGSVKPTSQGLAGMRLLTMENTEVSHFYFEGYNQPRSNPSVIVGGRNESTTTTAALASGATSVAVADARWMSNVLGNAIDLRPRTSYPVAIFPPDFLYGSRERSVLNGVARGAYEIVFVSGWVDNVAYLAERGKVGTHAQAWPAGAVMEEMPYPVPASADNPWKVIPADPILLNSDHLASMGDTTAGYHVVEDLANQKPVAELIVGLLPDRFFTWSGMGSDFAGSYARAVRLAGNTRLRYNCRVLGMGTVETGVGGQVLKDADYNDADAAGLSSYGGATGAGGCPNGGGSIKQGKFGTKGGSVKIYSPRMAHPAGPKP